MIFVDRILSMFVMLMLQSSLQWSTAFIWKMHYLFSALKDSLLSIPAHNIQNKSGIKYLAGFH